MTKLRDPATPYSALEKVQKVLGWDGVSTVTGKKIPSLRKLSDPDAGRVISLQDAYRLDAAFLRNGGVGSPFAESHDYQVFQLSVDVQILTAAPLMSAIATVAKEIGEAVAAAIELASQAEDARARKKAVREAEEGIEAMHALLTTLKRGAR